MRKLTKYKKIIIYVIISIMFIWIFLPYYQIWKLTNKYGDYFEERYKEISFYEDLSYLKPRVARYKNEKANIYTDAGSLKQSMDDKRNNVAVVYYGTKLYIRFCYVDNEWIIDGWDAIFTGPIDCQTWPVYFS